MRGDGSSGRRVSPAIPAIQHETVIVGVDDEGPGKGQSGERRGPRVIRGRIVRVRKRHRVALKEIPVAPQQAPAAEPVGSPAEPPAEPGPPPDRLAALLANAHRMQEMIDRGEVEGPAELATRLGVSRAWVAQMLAMAMIAPDIQAEILDPDNARAWSRRELSANSGSADWARQRAIRSGNPVSAERADAVSRSRGSHLLRRRSSSCPW